MRLWARWAAAVSILLLAGSACQGDIFQAAESGDAALVGKLLDGEADPNETDATGNAPLHIAASSGHLAAAELLLKHGADVNAKTKFGSTPLHCAAYGGHPEVARLLVTNDARVDVRDEIAATPLATAVFHGRTPVASLLLEHGAAVGARILDGTLLHWAAHRGHAEMVDLLLKHGADPMSKNEAGNTPAVDAARLGHFAIARLLCPESQAGLLLAAQLGYPVRLRQLVSTRRSRKQLPELTEALVAAVKANQAETVKVLLESGANAKAEVYRGGGTVWAAVRASASTEVVRLLLQHGARPDARPRNIFSKEYGTPKQMSHTTWVPRTEYRWDGTYEWRDKITTTWVETPEWSVVVESFSTPLSMATRQGNAAMVKLLLQDGAKPNARDHRSQTALHMAAECGHADVIRALLDHGAAVNARAKGTTPLGMAQNGSEAAAVLTEHGGSY